jgi:hypothetical protein
MESQAPTSSTPTSSTPTGGDQTATKATAPTSRTPGTGRPKPLYPSFTSWVEQHFIQMFQRTLGGEYRWCAQWWQHAEAISRLTALWYAWEALRLQGSTGMGIWYRDHLDHQLPYLMGARGPFYQCTEDQHLEPRRMRVKPVPDGWWTRPPGSGAAEQPGVGT